MSRFRKLTHTIWHCKYHIVWRPKYRLRILEGRIADDVQKCTRAFTVHQGCEVDELNIQLDHVHFIAMVPPKISISQFVGTVKGRTAIRRGASRGRPFFVQWTRSGRIGGFVGKGRHNETRDRLNTYAVDRRFSE